MHNNLTENNIFILRNTSVVLVENLNYRCAVCFYSIYNFPDISCENIFPIAEFCGFYLDVKIFDFFSLTRYLIFPQHFIHFLLLLIFVVVYFSELQSPRTKLRAHSEEETVDMFIF